MRNWRQSRLLGGITLALVLGDIVGVYVVQNKLAQRPEMPTLYVESASEAVANAARNFHRNVFVPSRSALASAETIAPTSAPVFEVPASKAVPPAEVIKEAPAIAEITPVVKTVSQPIAQKQESTPARFVAYRPTRTTQVSFSTAFARELALARTTNRHDSSLSTLREFPAPALSVQSAAAQEPSVSDAPVAVAETYPAPRLSIADSQSGGTVSGDSAANGAEPHAQSDSQPSPSSAPVAQSLDAELPAL